MYVRNRWLAGCIKALYIFGVCGAFSVLHDADHIMVLVAKGLPITWENLLTQSGRPFHKLIMLGCGLVCVIRLSLYSGRSNLSDAKV